MNFNDNELATIFLAIKKWNPKKAFGKSVKENIIERIDNYFTPGCILETQVFQDESDEQELLNRTDKMTKTCSSNHTCKLCAFVKRLKVINPCANCFHNQLFKPVAGNGECNWVEQFKSSGK